VSILDAPSQRRWALAVYVALLAWRLYDYSTLVKDDADSLFYFMKWTMIDGLFMYGLPALRIPWLEWSGPTSLALFVTHAFIDWILMFRVAVSLHLHTPCLRFSTNAGKIPVEAWLIGLTKLLYDRELAVSEKKVNPQEILRNSALILGKHTIHILPEG
jgi:nucleoporin POM152